MSTATPARRKRVFKHSREVAHIWAQQHQAYGCNPSRNIYFDGHTIFSYGSHFPIARFVYAAGGKPKLIDGKQVVLFTTRTYSVTTAGHLHDVRNALRGMDVQIIHVDRVEHYANQKDNLADLWLSLEVVAEQNVKARERTYCGDLASGVANLELFTRFAGIGRTKRLTTLVSLMRGNQAGWWYPLANITLERAAEIDNAKATRRGAREIREASQRAINLANAELRQQLFLEVQPLAVDAWRAGNDSIAIPQAIVDKWRDKVAGIEKAGTVSCLNYVGFSHNAPTLLRIVGDEIETSRGARVPVRHARVAWQALKRREIPADRLGEYTASRFEGDTLVIGCHRIAFTEIERLAKALGLTA